jgi:hypothetical protein
MNYVDVLKLGLDVIGADGFVECCDKYDTCYCMCIKTGDSFINCGGRTDCIPGVRKKLKCSECIDASSCFEFHDNSNCSILRPMTDEEINAGRSKVVAGSSNRNNKKNTGDSK